MSIKRHTLVSVVQMLKGFNQIYFTHLDEDEIRFNVRFLLVPFNKDISRSIIYRRRNTLYVIDNDHQCER